MICEEMVSIKLIFLLSINDKYIFKDPQQNKALKMEGNTLQVFPFIIFYFRKKSGIGFNSGTHNFHVALFSNRSRNNNRKINTGFVMFFKFFPAF